MKRLGLLFLISYVVSGGVGQAATYYVSKSGSNNNSCAAAQSVSTAKLTINAGIGCLLAGDTLLVRSGNYDEIITSVPSGTSWNNVVRIANYPGETVWLKPVAGGNGLIWLDCNCHYIEFDGINTDGTIANTINVWFSTNNGNDPHHIRYKNAEVIAGTIGITAIAIGNHTKIGATGSFQIQNVTIHGGGLPGLCGYECASYGIYVMGPNNLIENCNIYDTSGAAIHVYNADGDPPDGNIIRNNRLHDITRTGSLNQVWGIILANADNNQVYNNIIYGINVGAVNPGNAAITIGDGSQNNKIWNNTIYRNTNSGIYNAGANTELKNNITYGQTGANVVDNGSGTIQSNNLVGVDPLFADPSANNFQLQSGSRAIDAGVNVSAITTDLTGLARPQGSAFDIGAYEYRTQQAQPSAPAPPTGVRIVSN